MQSPLMATPRTRGANGSEGDDEPMDYVTAWDKLELARMMLRIYIKHNDITNQEIDQLQTLNEDIARKVYARITVDSDWSKTYFRSF